MTNTEDYEKVEVASAAALREWLETNHGREDSVWLVTYLKAAGDKYVARDEVLDELLAFGWIDGVRRKLDETRTMQLVCRRKTQWWSKTYKDRVARLTREGRMAAPGLEAVKAGKASGLWTFMDDVDALLIPSDLAAALAARPPASDRFDAYPSAYKRNVLRWLKLAKADATRAKRIEKIAATSAENARIPQM
ncbi:MAG: YdeI/OmpD-associated family protein [Pseudomonadota bacterium]